MLKTKQTKLRCKMKEKCTSIYTSKDNGTIISLDQNMKIIAGAYLTPKWI